MRNLMILSMVSMMRFGGCTGGATPLSQNDPSKAALLSDVQQKTAAVGAQIGGTDGFGGSRMDTYMQHVPEHMGFSSTQDLSDSGGQMMIRLHNESQQACTFHLDYLSSQSGAQEQSTDVSVPAGQVNTVEVPCSEMVGLGSLDTPGAIGCHLADGQSVGNQMALPGFLRMDYACGETYDMFLTPDTNDLDGDGNTQELILMSQSMQEHMGSGGPMGHMHAPSPSGGMGMGGSMMGG